MKSIDNKPIDLRDRSLAFTRAVINLIKPLQNNRLAQPINDQLLRSSSSVGANFIEAKNANSKRDFRHKVVISKKEAAEALYWLKIYEEFTDNPELFRLQKECQEIVLILQKIINTSRI